MKAKDDAAKRGGATQTRAEGGETPMSERKSSSGNATMNRNGSLAETPCAAKFLPGASIGKHCDKKYP